MKPVAVRLFIARCPLCRYQASAVRFMVDQETLAEHITYAHSVPKELG